MYRPDVDASLPGRRPAQPPDQLIIVDSLQLPSRVGQSVTEHTVAYDAFTELSTEDSPTSAPCHALIGISSGEPEPA
jgi:hypothetical protein